MTRDFNFYIAHAEEALAKGFSTKSARKDAIGDATSAYEQATNEISKELLAEPRDARRAGWDELYYGKPALHVWKPKHSAMFAAFPAALAKIEAAVALRAKIVAAPDAAKAPTKKAVEDAARLAVAKTCQICGRPILAETGVIAHHGYQRPGGGWQTASCYGARELPFEVSRDVLGEYIVIIEKQLVALETAQRDVKAEKINVWTSYKTGSSFHGTEKTVSFECNRETFAAAKVEHANYFNLSYGRTDWTFDDVKVRDVKERAVEIKQTREYLVHQQARFDAWKAAAK